MAEFSLNIRDEGDVVIIETTGYLNNVGGEKYQKPVMRKWKAEKNCF